MRPNRTNLSFAIVLSVALLASFPLFSQEAQAWRGGGGGGFGGFHGGGGGDGGFGGGSFHEGAYGGGSFSGAHGGQAAWGPGGRGVAQGPEGNTYYHGDGGGGGSYDRNVDVSRSYNVSGGGGWGYYGGGGAAAAGALAGLAIGATIASLPAAAQQLSVNNQTYYYDGTNYYQPCYGGSDVNYCVVSDPNQ